MLIAIEGIDGSGKTTVAKFLFSELSERGYDVVLLKEPTDSKWGRKLKESYTSRLSPEEELELFLKDREYDVRNNILPSLREGRIVIMDRYYFSTIAYQGALGFDINELREMNEKIAPKPDILIVLDLPPEEAVKRIKSRGKPNEFENTNYLKRVREIFLSMREAIIIDSRIDEKELKERVLEVVLRHLKSRAENSRSENFE